MVSRSPGWPRTLGAPGSTSQMLIFKYVLSYPVLNDKVSSDQECQILNFSAAYTYLGLFLLALVLSLFVKKGSFTLQYYSYYTGF